MLFKLFFLWIPTPIWTTASLNVNVSNELHGLLLWEDIPVSTGYRKCTYVYLSPLCSHVTTFGLSAFCIYLVFPWSSPCHLTTSCTFSAFPFPLVHLPTAISPFQYPLSHLYSYQSLFNCYFTVLLFFHNSLAIFHSHILAPDWFPFCGSSQCTYSSYVPPSLISYRVFSPFHSYHFVTQYSFFGIMLGGFILGEVQYEVNFFLIDRWDKIKHTKMVLTFFSFHSTVTPIFLFSFHLFTLSNFFLCCPAKLCHRLQLFCLFASSFSPLGPFCLSLLSETLCP